MKNFFYKYNCSGNTFVIVKYDSTIDYFSFSKKICDEYQGIGCDGLIVVKDDINEILFFNKDGSKAEFCGNGLRAVTHYLRIQKGLIKRTIPILFNNELYYGKVISLDPFCSEVKIKKDKIQIKKEDCNTIIKYKDYHIKTFPVKVGVFHVILLNETTLNNDEFLNEEDLIEIKNLLSLKYGVEPNLEVVKLDYNDKKIDEITFYERGVGYTKCCGSGSVAVGMILELMNFNLEEYVKIKEDLYIIIKEDYISLVGKSNLICWGKYL